LRNLSLRWLPELSQIVLQDGLLLLGDPGFDLRMQYVKRQSTAIKDFIVEGAKVKLVTKLLARFFTQLENFQLTELVGERLSGPRNVTVDFRLNVGFIHRCVFVEILNHLIARPVLGVDAGVDHKPDITPHFILKTPVFAIRILIASNFFAQPFGIQGHPSTKAVYPPCLRKLGRSGNSCASESCR